MSTESNAKPTFSLYVVAQNITTPRTIQGVKDALAALLGEEGFQLEIFDVIANPRSAFEGRVKATPTLIRTHPLPEVRVIGDMGKPELFIPVLGDVAGPRSRDYLSGKK